MPYERPDVVDKINAIQELVLMISDYIDEGRKDMESFQCQRIAFVLSHYVCGGLDECTQMLEEKDDQLEYREEEDQGSEASSEQSS
jgi:hypothetical protein